MQPNCRCSLATQAAFCLCKEGFNELPVHQWIRKVIRGRLEHKSAMKRWNMGKGRRPSTARTSGSGSRPPTSPSSWRFAPRWPGCKTRIGI